MTGPTWPPPAPLCNGGRCEAILTALATGGHAERLVEQQGATIACVIRRALDTLGLDSTDRDVGTAVAAAIREVAGAGKEPSHVR